jgi:hypothetical protein
MFKARRMMLLATGLWLGCMSERPTINRIQPDYLDKNDLIPNQYTALTKLNARPETLTPQMIAKEPIFYTQTTLIAKPTTVGFTGLTSYGEADKIRWEVTENNLIARQSYEFVKNAPIGPAGIGQDAQTGDVVAVFAIKSHFDIRRDYNPTTGEELNVLVENTTDRPWYQRRYMRVDWSQNLIPGYATIFEEQEWSGQLNAEPVPVFVNSPNDPNAPVFQYDGTGDNRKLTYFDVVNQAVLHPETTMLSYSDFPGSNTSYNSFPLCYVGEGEMDCQPAQVTLRVAFSRVDPAKDYEVASLSESLPDTSGNLKEIPHLNMERFGFFDRMRVGYDPQQHAVLDTQRLHVASRHNLWTTHHAPVWSGDSAQGCNFDSECKPGLLCHIQNTPSDAQHRGLCGYVGLDHRGDDITCSSDDDCHQYSDTGGVSRTAKCDQSTKTCGEIYYRCQSDVECITNVDPQSTCDLASAYLRADNRGVCLLPFRQRQVRQIPYHESNGYPDYMQPVTEQIVSEWNDAFVQAVTSARRHECELAMGLDPSTQDPKSNPCNTPGIVGLDPALGADAQFIFVGCHSPVWGTANGPGQHTQDEVDQAHKKGWDLPSCGPQGTSARIGDLRYSMIGAITDQDQQGYWGLANLATDPETGEMIAGRGAVWQTITDYYANQLIEYVQLLTSANLTVDQVITGGDLVGAMDALGGGKAGLSYGLQSQQTGQTPSAQILDAPLKQLGLDHVNALKSGIDRQKLPGSGWMSKAGMVMRTGNPTNPGALDRGLQRLLDGRMLGDGTNRGTSRLLSLAGTPLEAMMMNEQQARLAPTKLPDDNALLPSTLNAASPFRQQSSAVRHTIERIRSTLSAYQCGMEAGFQDDLLLGLAQRLATGAPIMQSDPLDKPVAFGRDWNFKKSGGGLDYDLMRTYARQFIHHGVLAHELGHSLGQRHNFTASADAINYNDQYWVVRMKGHAAGLRPRYEYLADTKNDGNYYSKDEIAGRIDEWSYSSVMDYKGLNEDAHGIGRYDYAFVKNGYVNMVEAFKNVTDNTKALTYAYNVAGNGMSTPLDLGEWPAKIHGMHYTQIPDIFGTNSDGTPALRADNRYDVFLKETTASDVSGWGTPSFSNATNDGHVLVPYRFDSDERAGLVWQDQRYDAGPDPFESRHYVTSHLIDYYFMNSYARLRSGFSTEKYVTRMWSRYLDQLRQTTQINAFDLIEWQDFFSSTPNFNAYMTDPKELGGHVNLQAMSLSVDTMVAILSMPEVGGHVNQKQFDNTNLIVPDTQGTGQSPFNIAINDGRAFESNWRNDAGFWWYDMLDRAGAYYDKVMMLQALTDPDLLLLARDTPSDIRLFELNFYTMFPDQMVRLFGSLLSEDVGDFAPIVSQANGQQVISRAHVATMNSAPRTIDATHQLLDPQDHFTIQLWAAVQTMAQFPATYDQRYMDLTRLWIDGSVEQITTTSPTVYFPDPFSGQTYRALHFSCSAQTSSAGACDPVTGACTLSAPGVGCSPYLHLASGKVSDEAGVAAKMLLHLQDLEQARQNALTAKDTATAGNLEQQERKYLDLVNVMRSLTVQFGHGISTTP